MAATNFERLRADTRAVRPRQEASVCLACGAEVVVTANAAAGYVSVFDPSPSPEGQVQIDFTRGRWKSLTPAQAKGKPGPDEHRYCFHRCQPYSRS